MLQKDYRFQRHVLLVNALIPLLLICWDALDHQLGVNPVEFVTRASGVLTLLFVVLSLGITPLRKIFHLAWLQPHRRTLGLLAFFYGSLHLATYLAFDRGLDITGVPADIVKRPFIAVGMICFSMMIALAATSTHSMVRRLGGKRWARLHQLNYLIAIGGVIHFWMIVKSDIRHPVLFGLAVLLLLAYRWRVSTKSVA